MNTITDDIKSFESNNKNEITIPFKTAGKLSKTVKFVFITVCLTSIFCISAGFKQIASFAQEGVYEKDNIMIKFIPSALKNKNTKNIIQIPNSNINPNPFLPARGYDIEPSTISDIPKFDLVAPPETIDEGSDAARVMDTIVSGIMYDKKSPSAIINIEGNDFLVKKGDTISNYNILDITPESVTVKLGQNTYKAGIGEVLTQGEIHNNEISNLSKRFGGNKI